MSKKSGKSSKKSSTRRKLTIEEGIVKNLIALQKVHTDLAEKFDKLTKELSQLLALFESAAHNFAKHPAVIQSQKDKDFLNKIDTLLEQNKTIAKGLMIMEEKIRDKMHYNAPSVAQLQKAPPARQGQYQSSMLKRPLPKF